MKIESLIKRVGGTVIDMDAPTRQYHFKPESGQPHEAPHVAIVKEMTHAKALLRIREGFRLVEGEVDAEEDAEGFLPSGKTLMGSNVHNASYDIAGGETIQLGELVVMAFQDSGLSYEQWEELPDQERYEFIDASLRELQAGEGVLEDEEQKQPAPVAAETPPVLPPAEPAAPVQEAPTPVVEEQKQPAPVEQANERQPVEKQTEKPLAERPRKELAALYKARFNREPSTRMSIADIAAALSEDDD